MGAGWSKMGSRRRGCSWGVAAHCVGLLLALAAVSACSTREALAPPVPPVEQTGPVPPAEVPAPTGSTGVPRDERADPVTEPLRRAAATRDLSESSEDRANLAAPPSGSGGSPGADGIAAPAPAAASAVDPETGEATSPDGGPSLGGSPRRRRPAARP